ncbi:Receptor protein kinase CLAVATA1 [Dichanthelium oligosanthes]|uniref:Receptor protein kinase CLAVATA1 n=1 Tax=Dichanthelium oligosanthes TaxID=888268 RepID=A0A1E5VBT2_9POAL|nr:Receptor protein kinase CLAVATA1 [Dichanthelium oligosanthes]
MREMISLAVLDVSYNNLSGRVPQSQLQGVFAVSDASESEGNPGLCVEHVTAASCRRLQRSRRPGVKTRTMLLWLVPTVSAVAVAAMAMEENVVARGGAGTVYRCATRGGAEVAVKRLPGPGRRDHGFWAEVGTLGGVRHRNIVRLLGFASGAEGNLLLYEYMPAGSLGGVLHGERGALLGWGARHRVATSNEVVFREATGSSAKIKLSDNSFIIVRVVVAIQLTIFFFNP